MADSAPRRPDLAAALRQALAIACAGAPPSAAAGAGVPPAADSDPIEAAERQAIMQEPALPPPGSAARARLDAKQREAVAGLLAVARVRRPD